MTLFAPSNPSQHNGIAIADIINTVTIGTATFVIGGRAVPEARLQLGDDFLFGLGNVYVDVMWYKSAVEALGNGSIATLPDGYTIIADVADLARDPKRYIRDQGDFPQSSKVVAYGFSQTASLLRGWYIDHLNGSSGRAVFDGAILVGPGGCRDLNTGEGKSCPGTLSDGGKVIVLSTQTDVELGGDANRADAPDYRVYEIAGVSHIPITVADFRRHGMPDQNPVDFGPIARAALVNMQAWMKGVEPPANI